MPRNEDQDFPGFLTDDSANQRLGKPAAGFEQPAIWVKGLAIYKDWPPSEATLLRRMKLRRGLNILWAKPSDGSNPENKLTGHGAGKTTFCRMLRYILDDATFGNKEFREAFNDTERNGFRNGWALGEVIVDGNQWLVGRPLGHVGYQSFAKKDGTLDDAFPESPTSAGYEAYRTAFDTAVFGRMKLRQLSGSGRKLEWESLLGWLARDQEAHYSGLLEWRHPDSDHQTDVLSYLDKENLVRLVLGLINPDEQEVHRAHAKKSADHEDGVREKPKIEFWIKRSRTTLEELLGRKVADPRDPLLQEEIKRLVLENEKKADAATASVGFDKELDELAETVAKREAEWRWSRVVLMGWINRLPKNERDLEAARQQATDAEQQQAIRALSPFRGYCSHPLNRAWREQCPLADDRPTDDQVDEVLQSSISAADEKEQERLRLDGEIKAQEKVVSDNLSSLNTARRALESLRARRNSRLNELNAPRQLAANMKAAFEDFKRAVEASDTLTEELERLEKEKRKLDGELAVFAKQHGTLVRAFSEIFHHIVQTAMGHNLIGSVEFSGKGIEPRVHDHARRDSPAIKVAKFIAFDLAAMILTMTTGEGYHPRFLLHDSPRESDLDAAVYRSLFLVARELEAGEESPFQYIVTTTESPPADVNGDPWLLKPTLNAAIASERFLGVDL